LYGEKGFFLEGEKAENKIIAGIEKPAP